MDLHSPQDRILLKNCITIKINQLKLMVHKPNQDFSALKNAIDYYSKLKEILETDDIETLIATLNHSIKEADYLTFNQSILSTSAKDLAEEYIDLTKSMMMDNGSYSDEKFEKLKEAFYRGNENLVQSDMTKNLNELEEENEHETSDYLTETIQAHLNLLKELFQNANPKTMSALDFKSFSAHLKKLIKDLGIYKLQQALDKTKQTILDMHISYENFENSKSIYEIHLTLLDSASQTSHKTLTEKATTSGFISTYVQNLCYSYLEAKKYSLAEETLLDSNIIMKQMNIFSDCYQKLKDMAKYKLNILSNNTIGVSSTATDEPTKDCNMIEAYTAENKIELI